jgi:hypothetical protein
MIAKSVIALSLVSLFSFSNAYPVKVDDLQCRTGPGTNYKVVKQYKKGEQVSLTCQAPGTDINGDSLWDKTTDGCYVTDYYVYTGTSGYVTSKCGGSGGGGNLPGLDSTQSSHARAIIAQAKSEKLGRQGCLAGIATALTEVCFLVLDHALLSLSLESISSILIMANWAQSSILVYANSNVPSSLHYSHDAVGDDHDSVGIFQQRAVYYPNIAADMDPAKSAAQFFAKMKAVNGWKTMNVGELCQKVQGSAYPSRYEEHLSAAESICSADKD